MLRPAFLVRSSTALALLGLLGQAGCQSFETGMLTLCDAPKNCEACKGAAPEDRSRLLAEHIERHVRNSDAVGVATSIEHLSMRDRIEVLRENASNAGVAGCKLADEWEAELATLPQGDETPPTQGDGG